MINLLEMLESPSGAIFDETDKYRYVLFRRLSEPGEGVKPVVSFIGLNPSTADAVNDDPTVRRCINYSKAWGAKTFFMLNIFAFRATDPKEMKRTRSPIGSGNDFHILEVCKLSDIIVAAWGAHGDYRGRGSEVFKLVTEAGFELKCLGCTKAGLPRHPLYLRKDLKPEPLTCHPAADD